ncbi:uL30 family ribosomal protein [Patescibacteria group bacterium]|nr:uL30 family ribosomal protein [Patescibacteria group bacterium]
MEKRTCIIRIRGRVGLKKDVKETLDRLRIRRKYSCVVIIPNKDQEGMIKRIRSFVTYGEIKKDTFEKLIEKRAQVIDKNKSKKEQIDPKKIIEELDRGKRYEDLNLKPFFRLHPPRGGIESKKHVGEGKGILGHNEKINELLERML